MLGATSFFAQHRQLPRRQSIPPAHGGVWRQKRCSNGVQTWPAIRIPVEQPTDGPTHALGQLQGQQRFWEGDGVVHSLLYGDEGKNLIDNLTAASADIRTMMTEIGEGKGTLGALIKDPSVYEDVKGFLGGAKRNKVLKSYVRDTIRKNERSEGLSEAGAVQ